MTARRRPQLLFLSLAALSLYGALWVAALKPTAA